MRRNSLDNITTDTSFPTRGTYMGLGTSLWFEPVIEKKHETTHVWKHKVYW